MSAALKLIIERAIVFRVVADPRFEFTVPMARCYDCGSEDMTLYALQGEALARGTALSSAVACARCRREVGTISYAKPLATGGVA